MTQPADARPIALIVEDEPIQRMMLVDHIEEAGFDTVEAMSAEDAVDILENRLDIRVVFTDIDMPGGFEGMKLAAMIRDRWPPIELILTSSAAAYPDVDAIPARAVVLSKPYRKELLIKAVQRFLD